MPPSQVARSSQRSRPLSASHSGRPVCEQLARPRRQRPPARDATAGTSGPAQVGLVGGDGSGLLLWQIDAAALRSRAARPARSSSTAAPCRSRPTTRRAWRRRSRRSAAPAGRPGWRSAGSSRARRPRWHSGVTPTSWRNALSRSSKRSQRAAACRGWLRRARERSAAVAGGSPGRGRGPGCCEAAAERSRVSQPSSRRVALVGERVAFVGEVVGRARKRVDGGNVRRIGRGSSSRGDREVLVVRRGPARSQDAYACIEVGSPLGLGHARRDGSRPAPSRTAGRTGGSDR